MLLFESLLPQFFLTLFMYVAHALLFAREVFTKPCAEGSTLVWRDSGWGTKSRRDAEYDKY